MNRRNLFRSLLTAPFLKPLLEKPIIAEPIKEAPPKSGVNKLKLSKGTTFFICRDGSMYHGKYGSCSIGMSKGPFCKLYGYNDSEIKTRMTYTVVDDTGFALGSYNIKKLAGPKGTLPL